MCGAGRPEEMAVELGKDTANRQRRCGCVCREGLYIEEKDGVRTRLKEEGASGAELLRGKLARQEPLIFHSCGPRDTFLLGRLLGEGCGPGEVYTLTGDLGVGKTLFTQGFAAGLGVSEPVSSPTFTILQEYDTGRLPFYHFDVYRIADVEEMEEIGWEDHIYGQGVCMIEWAEIVEEILPERRFRLLIEKDLAQGVDYRRITLEKR